MGIGSLIKQPGESRLYSMEFAANLAAGETIATVDSVTASPSGLTIGSPVANGTKADVRISGGTAPTTYKVTFTVTTSASNILEAEGVLVVRQL